MCSGNEVARRITTRATVRLRSITMLPRDSCGRCEMERCGVAGRASGHVIWSAAAAAVCRSRRRRRCCCECVQAVVRGRGGREVYCDLRSWSARQRERERDVKVKGYGCGTGRYERHLSQSIVSSLVSFFYILRFLLAFGFPLCSCFKTFLQIGWRYFVD